MTIRELTIRELYETTKLKMIRLYVCSKPIDNKDNDKYKEVKHTQVKDQAKRKSATDEGQGQEKPDEDQGHEKDKDNDKDTNVKHSPIKDQVKGKTASGEGQRQEIPDEDQDHGKDEDKDQDPNVKHTPDKNQDEVKSALDVNQCQGKSEKSQDHGKEPVDEEKVQTSMPSIPSDLICEDDLFPVSNSLNLSSDADDAFCEHYADGSDDEIIFGPSAQGNVSLDSTLPMQSNPVQSASSRSPAVGNSSLDSTLSLPRLTVPLRSRGTSNATEPAGTNPENDVLQKYYIRIRRGHTLVDLIKLFNENPSLVNCAIEVEIVLPNGTKENGGGVGAIRDILTEFWQEFYERCTVGADVKVPFIRHDYEEKVARIFLKGYKEVEYIPLQLAQPFLDEALYCNSIEGDELLSAFLGYVAKSEQDVLKGALEEFESVNQDELLEILDIYKCKRNPTKNTFKDIIKQIAHMELIQAPMFVIDCWKSVLTELKYTLSKEELHSLMKTRHPTNRNVVKQLIFPETMS